ncbi:MAG TPA: YidC/Oxa1 family membrane protein insertase [Chthonomonadaceae bacterium]|nr:YidC/Oxa1 family membrane protein insertase [Chthonomonadaceae bacterium]
MKFISRTLALLALVVLLGGVLSGCVPGSQGPSGHYTLDQVKAMETTAPAHKVLDAYAAVKREYSESGKDQSVAAQALLREAEFAASDNYGKVDEQQLRERIDVKDPNRVPDAVREQREQMRSEGDYRAHDALKQLFKEYPNSQAAAIARQENLKQILEDRIDQRNSTGISYKIVDVLVAATGRLPAFSYWFALVIIAVLVKLITLPLTLRMYRSQREMQRIQPVLKEIQEKYKGKPELNEKVMATYKEHGINPFASCLPMVIQLPFMIWVYNMIRQYEFHFSHGKFLWIGSALSFKFPDYLATNLAQFDLVLLLIYAASNYLTMKLTPPADPQQAQQQKSMSIMMTGMMIWMFLLYRWSAAFMLYWLVLNLMSAWQQYVYIYKRNTGLAVSANGTITLPAEPKEAKETSEKPRATGGASGTLTTARPATSTAGGDGMRPRPRRKKR